MIDFAKGARFLYPSQMSFSGKDDPEKLIWDGAVLSPSGGSLAPREGCVFHAW
jgi:hypothetical protein